MGRKGSGVEIRDKSIRLCFVVDGEPLRERLTINGKSLEPTPANVRYAHRVADEIRKKLSMGTFALADYFPDSARVMSNQPETLGSLADLWLDSQGRLSAASKDQYATAVRFWKRLLGTDTPITEVTHKLLASKIGGYPWPSPKTHNNYLIALRGLLALEYSGAKTLANPIAGIENMPVVKRLPDPLTAPERDQILADLRAHYDLRVYAYFLWEFYTGMRPEETIALRWSDIDFGTAAARVQRVRTFRGTEREGTKTHLERDVDLVDEALEALQIMKAHTYLLKAVRDGEEDTSADIFQNPVTGRPWHDERSQRDHYWKPAMKRLGIRWRRAYNTRHTFATVALMGEVPPSYIASQLGHSIKMLLEKYARWIPGGDGGRAKDKMRKVMNSSHELPTKKNGSAK